MSAIIHNALEDERPTKRTLTEKQREEQEEERRLKNLLSELIYYPQNDEEKFFRNPRVKRVNDSPALNLREHAVTSAARIYDKRPKKPGTNKDLTPSLRKSAVKFVWDWVFDTVKATYVDSVFHDTVINFDRYFSVTKLEGVNDKERAQHLRRVMLACLSLTAKFYDRDYNKDNDVLWDDVLREHVYVIEDVTEEEREYQTQREHMHFYVDVLNSGLKNKVLETLEYSMIQTSVYDLLEQTLHHLRKQDAFKHLQSLHVFQKNDREKKDVHNDNELKKQDADKAIERKMIECAREMVFCDDLYFFSLENIVAAIIIPVETLEKQSLSVKILKEKLRDFLPTIDFEMVRMVQSHCFPPPCK